MQSTKNKIQEYPEFIVKYETHLRNQIEQLEQKIEEYSAPKTYDRETLKRCMTGDLSSKALTQNYAKKLQMIKELAHVESYKRYLERF